MYPAPNDTDWQVARFQHHEMVAHGQHQQFIASALAPNVERGRSSASISRQVAVALTAGRKRLRGALVSSGTGSGTGASMERGAAV